MLADKKQNKLLTILAGLGLYLITSGISYATFSYLRTPPEVDFTAPIPEGGSLSIDPSEPKTEACPLNGQLFTITERKIWETRRPLTVMIENHSDSRPQSGLSYADIVYEAVAEGGITRFMAVYLCDAVAQEQILGPVRSARTYFLDWASEYGEKPLYVHVGGANLPGPANAIGQIEEYGWGGRSGNDLNQFSIGYPIFWRDYERLGRTVATEHTMYSTTEKLWTEGKKRGWSNKDLNDIDWQDKFKPWKFTAESNPSTTAQTREIAFDFWSGYSQYHVVWKYNQNSQQYSRETGGKQHLDLNSGQALSAKTVIVQLVSEKGPIDELKHLLYKTTGSGKALIFQNGAVEEATWSKKDRKDRTIFTAKSGKEMVFSPGKIWIEILPSGNSVDY